MAYTNSGVRAVDGWLVGELLNMVGGEVGSAWHEWAVCEESDDGTS